MMSWNVVESLVWSSGVVTWSGVFGLLRGMLGRDMYVGVVRES